MIRLKNLLQSKWFYILFILFVICIYFIKSKYEVSIRTNNNMEGIIKNINIKSNKLSIQINSTIANYYIDTIEERDYIINNYELGDTIRLDGEHSIIKDNSNFNLFNYRLYLRSKKIYYLFKVSNIELISKNKNIFYKIKNKIINKINKSKNKDYLNAFILGNTNYIEEESVSSFRINGISHLFAISGMHISLLSGIILFVLNKIRKNDINYIITILFLLFYSFLANNSPSIMRAFLLFSFLFFNKKLKLEIKTIYILLLILGMMIIYNPYYIYNVGFVFSFTISIFLVLYSSIANKYKNYFIKLFIISLISFMGSIPIMINNFYSINLLSPLLNIIFVPFVSIIIFPLSLVCFFLPFLSILLSLSLNILEFLSINLSKIDFFVIGLKRVDFIFIIGYYLLIIFILEMMKRNKYYFFIILILFIIHSNLNIKYEEIHFIDVGQGDSILIRLKNNKNILIDTGGVLSYEQEEWKKKDSNIGKNIVLPYLKSLGIKKIDYLLLTHGDEDHVGEAIYLIDNYKISNVLLNTYNNIKEDMIVNRLKEKNINYLNISTYTLNIGAYELNFINKSNINENEDSLILLTKINNKNILLMGDAGKDSEEYIMSEYKLPKVDILKIGHHGSKYSSSERFLETVNPNYAVIMVGENNRFKHPHKITIDKLSNLSIPYYLTSINGSIKMVLKDDIEIYTCK